MLRLALLVEKKRNGGEKKKTFITHARRWMYQELEVAGVCAKLGHCDPTYGGRKGHCRISGNSAAAAISPPAGSRFLLASPILVEDVCCFLRALLASQHWTPQPDQIIRHYFLSTSHEQFPSLNSWANKLACQCPKLFLWPRGIKPMEATGQDFRRSLLPVEKDEVAPASDHPPISSPNSETCLPRWSRITEGATGRLP